ncbi:hypothetical protein R2Q81_04040 [Microbacterium aquimaris]|uniref:hypothetical protein n=1 Tax=Microbacterium aquimaris TaxID=459816 RepID=UPI002AD27098|nr:hypothetical protein [Microbacterium aquimaris]MDZ8275118.1 hypothetical protein [Microbacterium aquimaris]
MALSPNRTRRGYSTPNRSSTPSAVQRTTGTSPPTRPSSTRRLPIYNESEHQDRFGDPVLDIDVFVTSGHNPDGAANSGAWFDSTPSSIHTCYRLSISLVAGQVWNINRTSDFLDEQLSCPRELVDAAGEHTEYREPREFDG